MKEKHQKTEDSQTTKTHTKQYKVVATKNNLALLEKDIAVLLNDGWELAGGVTVGSATTAYETSTVFAQAVTREIEE